MKVISWNLWHRRGAVLAHLAALIEAEHPDLLLMQEAKPNLSELTDVVGGHFHFLELPKRVYGLGAWTPHDIPKPDCIELPSSRLPGRVPPRLAQLLHVRGIGFANVHLSHGQVLNGRQVRVAAGRLGGRAAMVTGRVLGALAVDVVRRDHGRVGETRPCDLPESNGVHVADEAAADDPDADYDRTRRTSSSPVAPLRTS